MITTSKSNKLISLRAAHAYHSSKRTAVGDKSLQRGSAGRCEEGWLYTLHYCLLNTGLDEVEAGKVCEQYGAEQVRGICVKEPLDADLSPIEEDDVNEEEASSTADFDYQCAPGWTQYKNFCFFKPGPAPEVCSLFGAHYLFNHCVSQLPHRISVDLLKSMKRLEGSDYDMHRETRMCCCGGGGLCK